MACGHRSGRPVARSAALLGLLLAGRALALDPSRAPAQYVHSKYDRHAGLPSNLVQDVAQTPDGHLWLATSAGLARFDGARFAVLDRRSQAGMPSDAVVALAPDGAGGLWAGTANEGLLHVLGDEVTAPAVAGPAGPSVRHLRALARDPSGDLWVGTHDHGAFRLRGGEVVAVYGAAQGLPGTTVGALRVDPAGGVWVGTDRGVVRIRDGAIEPGPAGLAGMGVRAIARDPSGALWFGTNGRGVARLEGGRLTFFGVKDGLPSDDVQALLVDRDGNLWAGTLLGLAVVRRGRVASLAAEIPGCVNALFEDAEGGIWAGREGGLDRLRDGDFETYGPPEGLQGREVGSISELPDGSVWVATATGLSRWNGERFAPVLAGARGVGYVLAQHLDARGSLWVSTRGGSGAWLSEWRGRRAVRSWPGAPGTPPIVAIASQPDGTLWLGTTEGVLRMRDGALEPVPGLPPRTGVNSLAVDAAGVLWAATELEWVWRLDGGRLVPAPDGGPQRRRTAICLLAEADGSLWVGTEGSGLWRLRGGRWASFDRGDGMFDDAIWAVLDDGRGRLWFSGDRGVWSVERRQLEARAAGEAAPVTSIAYGEADGMRSRECNALGGPPALRGRDGRLWFATTDGVAVVDPARLRPRPPAPRALVEAVRGPGRPARADGAIELPAGAARLEIAYSAATLREAEFLRFRYRLEGFDQEWIEAGTARMATYTNLPPGRYRFEVQAGTASEGFGPLAQLAVVQRPRFHQTGWFVALAGSALALLAFGAHLARTWRLRAHERALEARVREALAEVKTLSGLIPICAWCKKIRDDQGYWQRLESYLSQRSEAEFSHGMCPDCCAKICPADAVDGAGEVDGVDGPRASRRSDPGG